MYADYICEKCGKTKEVNWSIKEGAPSEAICDCGESMKRKWSSNIVIPEHMKAVNEDSYYEKIKKNITHSHPTDDLRKLKGLEPRGKIFY